MYLSMIKRTRKESDGNEMVTIASKVPKDAKLEIKAIAESFGMTFYELLQGLLLALLRYFDSGRLVTYNHNCMMNALANAMYTLKGSYCPFQKKGSENRKIKSAILFIEDSPKKRPQLLSIKNDDGQMMESLNFDKMISDFLGCIDPEGLQRLEYKKKELGYFSIAHTLHELIMQRTNDIDTMKADIGDMFTDIRIPSGQAVNEDIQYKRGYRKNLNEYTTITDNQKYRADI